MALNSDAVITEIWRTLDSNATFQGSEYLGSSGKIWKGQHRPAEVENPVLTVWGGRTIDAATALEVWSILVTAYADDLDNRTADISRLGRLTDEVIRTIEAATLSVTQAKIFNVYAIEDKGPKQSAARAAEHKQEIGFRLHAIET